MISLASCVAVVTGASSGIGRAIALDLAHQGAIVWLVGRSSGRLAETVAAAGEPASRLIAVVADLTVEAELEDLAARILAKSPRLDILVHAAGTFRMGTLADLPAEELDALYRVNLRVPYLLTQRLLPALVLASGQIVFVNSSAAVAPSPRWSAYCACKSALRSLADSLRAEVNSHGVRVLSVFPGRTATPMQEAIFAAEGRPYAPETLLQAEDVAAAVIHALRLPRSAELTELHLRPMRKSG